MGTLVWQQRSPLLLQPLLLAATLLLLASSAAAQPAALIVKFTDQAYQQARSAAAAAGAATPASAAAGVAAVAAAAAAARGETRQGQQRVAEMAAAAAESKPLIGLLSSQLSDRAARLGLKVDRRVPISTVFQGAVLEIGFNSSDQADMLKQQLEADPTVEKVWISQTVRIPTPVKGPTAPLAAAAAAASSGQFTASTNNGIATGIDVLRLRYNTLTGSKTLICIIDTGVNANLQIFGSCTGVGQPPDTCKLVVGYDLVGDRFNGFPSGGPPVEDPYPNDCYGHGTAVASVAMTSNGIAPDALLGAYRVFGCSPVGTSNDAVLIPAVDRAVRDGCHIINLSLSAGSGYADKSPYADVMAAAWKKGVLAVKAAGNDGDDHGWFQADVTIAAGAASIGSVGSYGRPLDIDMAISPFSSYGPEPTLKLGPHVCAPGTQVLGFANDGSVQPLYGTSFSSPYTSGLLALWRQYKQMQADTAKQALDLSTMSQDAMLKRLVWSARPVREQNNILAEPVLRCGGGIIQADALIANQLTIEPSVITLPSGITQPYSTTLKLTWEGPAHPDRFVTYEIAHVPAYSVPLNNGWYTNFDYNYYNRRVQTAAGVVTQPSEVVLDTTAGKSVNLKVTFSLPSNLTAKPLLYSGHVVLTPNQPASNSTLPPTTNTTDPVVVNCTAVDTNSSSPLNDTNGTLPGDNTTIPVTTNCTAANGSDNSTSNPQDPLPTVPIPQISIPYQGFSQPYSALKVMAQPSTEKTNRQESNELTSHGSMLCYAPRSRLLTPGAIVDRRGISDACPGGYPSPGIKTVAASLGILRNFSACSLRITMAPEVPMRWLNVTVLEGNTGNSVAGTMGPIYTGNGDCLADARALSSWCLNFNGTVITTSGTRRRLTVGKTYRLRAWVEGPVAAGDAAMGQKPTRQRVDIKGILKILK